MPDHTEDINIAKTLRDIATNSDKVTGKILRKIDRAAKQGKYYLKIKTSEDVYNYLDAMDRKLRLPIKPPLVEKLFSLGFKLSESWESGFFNPKVYYLTIWW